MWYCTIRSTMFWKFESIVSITDFPACGSLVISSEIIMPSELRVIPRVPRSPRSVDSSASSIPDVPMMSSSL